MDHIKPGMEGEVRKILNQAENYFKHADRDHEDTLDFYPEQSEFFILESCYVYARLAGEFPPILKLFPLWFIAHRPHAFNFTEEERNAIDPGAHDILKMGREKYFAEVLPMLQAIHA